MKTTQNYIDFIKELKETYIAKDPDTYIKLMDLEELLKTHTPYTVTFSTVHLGILIKVFNHVVQTGSYYFKKSDLPNLTRTEYGNLFTLQRFGLLFFTEDEEGKRVKGGEWGIPLKRVYAFLNGNATISKYYTRDKLIGKNFPSEEQVSVHQIKNSTDTFKNIVPDFVNYKENE